MLGSTEAASAARLSVVLEAWRRRSLSLRISFLLLGSARQLASLDRPEILQDRGVASQIDCCNGALVIFGPGGAKGQRGRLCRTLQVGRPAGPVLDATSVLRSQRNGAVSYRDRRISGQPAHRQ